MKCGASMPFKAFVRHRHNLDFFCGMEPDKEHEEPKKSHYVLAIGSFVLAIVSLILFMIGLN